MKPHTRRSNPAPAQIALESRQPQTAGTSAGVFEMHISVFRERDDQQQTQLSHRKRGRAGVPNAGRKKPKIYKKFTSPPLAWPA
jgi:hypothetical protein